jgi:hypothetical protein
LGPGFLRSPSAGFVQLASKQEASKLFSGKRFQALPNLLLPRIGIERAFLAAVT